MSGSTIVTFLGNTFDYKGPGKTKYDIKDIAHSLSLTNRYRGHTSVPYSVAEHCVRVSRECHNDPLAGLLHDAAEAYIGDISSPQKTELGWMIGGVFHPFDVKERNVLHFLGKQLQIPGLEDRTDTAEVHDIDRRMFLTEVRDLLPESVEFLSWAWGDLLPFEATIHPISWEAAEALFLSHFDTLIAGEGR